MGIIIWLIVGGIVGWLASIIMKRDAQQGVLLNIVVGIVGALIGVPARARRNMNTWAINPSILAIVSSLSAASPVATDHSTQMRLCRGSIADRNRMSNAGLGSICSRRTKRAKLAICGVASNRPIIADRVARRIASARSGVSRGG